MSRCPINENLVRFARAHLPTATERRVYAVVAGSSDIWTARGAAKAAQVSDHEADQALRCFGRAGIVGLAGNRHPARYRWRAEMAYLYDDSEPAWLRDPVCGMPVAPGTPLFVEENAVVTRFCSLPCLVRRRSTNRHLVERPGGGHEHG